MGHQCFQNGGPRSPSGEVGRNWKSVVWLSTDSLGVRNKVRVWVTIPCPME